METEKAALKRSLSSLQIELISLGAIIGSSYFLGLGALMAENGILTIFAFLLGGLIVWLVAMAIGELAVGMPREGSFVSQSRELMGRPWSAGIGWSYWFNWCAYIPSEMVAGGMILHVFFPSVPIMFFAVCFGIIITGISLLNVKNFSHIESVLAVLKIVAMIGFAVIAVLVCVGLAGGSVSHAGGLLSSNRNLNFPSGTFGFLVTMVLVLINFQGAELVALSAAESKHPEKSVPRAARNVAFQTIALYVIPLTLLMLIFPWTDAKVEQSVFVEALTRNGFTKFAVAFQVMIVFAALNCSNSGLYGAVRSLYGLGKEGLAPRWTTLLNAQGVPVRATWLTLAVSWCFLPLYVFFQGSTFYVWLLSVSGFTGAICWTAISWCQIRLRREMNKNGKSASSLAFHMPGYPYLSYLSFGLQAMCLLLVALHPTLRTSLILGVPAFALPAMICWLMDRRNVAYSQSDRSAQT